VSLPPTSPGATARLLAVLPVMVAAGIGLVVCYFLAAPFIPALTWALVLAIVMAPLHERLERRLRRDDFAALASVAVAALAVALPLLFVLQQLVREAARGAAYLESTLAALDGDTLLASLPGVATIVRWVLERIDPQGAVASLAEWLTGRSSELLVGSIGQAVTFVLTFYLLFYFLRDRVRAVAAIVELSPLRPEETARMLVRFSETVHATLIGTVFVAAVQGTLGGLMFWWLGLPTPVFWGLVMGLLAIVPVLGAFVVWVPAAIVLALQGQWVSAAVLTVWGGVIVAGIDNLLYPMLVGRRLKLHTVVAFIGAVGGILLFGASGLVLGPAAIAVTIILIEILRDRVRDVSAPAAEQAAVAGVVEAEGAEAGGRKGAKRRKPG
jgi:predicted PurR-regulated permease PerM